MSPIVAIPGMPGESIDSRILHDVLAIIKEYRVKITDGYAPKGTGNHSPFGEHPLGLGVDIEPDTSRGGTWDDVDALARWAEPRQGAPRSPFRWVGYNGDYNHGRGNHLHLSWLHPGGNVVTAKGDIPDHDRDGERGGGLRGALTGAATAVGLGPAGAIAGAVAGATDAGGAVAGAAAGAAGDAATAMLNLLWDAFGEDGSRIVLYIVLVVGGATLTVIGLSRALGVGAPSLSTIAAVTPVGRAAKVAGGAKAAGTAKAAT